MDFNGDIVYLTPITKEFYSDCIRLSVFLKLDRMPDNSWYRMMSDKPLSWVFENINKITSSRLSVRKHQLKKDDERWTNDSHIELNVEARENNITYLLTIEIDSSHLNYLTETYCLDKI
jgi:hypothetical protein